MSAQLDVASILESAGADQHAPVDLEQFRLAVEALKVVGNALKQPDLIAESGRLLSIIDNAGKVAHQPAPVVPTLPGNWPEDAGHENGDYECLCSQCGATFYGHKRRAVCRVCAKPAPVVDDARMARALEAARCGLAPEHVSAIEEAIAAYDPNCGARTVRVVDDAMRELIEAAEHGREQLQRALEIEQECTCEPCPQCGRDPNGCSETQCAETCHCSLCDYCCFQGGIEGLTAALARAQGVQS